MGEQVRMSEEPPSDCRSDWHEELTGQVFGLMLGVSRLMAHVRDAPRPRKRTGRGRSSRAQGAGVAPQKQGAGVAPRKIRRPSDRGPL